MVGRVKNRGWFLFRNGVTCLNCQLLQLILAGCNPSYYKNVVWCPETNDGPGSLYFEAIFKCKAVSL